MNRPLTAILAALTLFLAACGENSTDSASVTAANTTAKTPGNTTAAIAEKSQTLLFFMNPHGKPCQDQDAILKGMSDHLASGNVRVKYIKTTEMASARRVFMKYGVRALPQIIVLDTKGLVKKRFSPGIHNQFSLMAAVE